MSLRLIIPPASLAVSMAAARTAARADVGEDGTSPLDGEIESAIRVYTAEAEGETRRAIMEQTWRLTLDRFGGAIELRKPPLLQVDHIMFYDVDGVQRTLDPRDYLVDAESEPGYVLPAPGHVWPPTQNRVNAVEVQYRCGYGVDIGVVPFEITGFVLARVGEHFQSGGQPKNELVKRLLWPLVVHG